LFQRRRNHGQETARPAAARRLKSTRMTSGQNIDKKVDEFWRL
jgi:hypothetical protein